MACTLKVNNNSASLTKYLLIRIMFCSFLLMSNGDFYDNNGNMTALQEINKILRQGEFTAQQYGLNPTKVRYQNTSGRFRYSDGSVYNNGKLVTLQEVKNVAKQGLTAQIRDYLAYCEANGLKFQLIVDYGTRLSTPLQMLTEGGKILLIRGNLR